MEACMIRAVVFLTVALAAASLGFAQDSSRNPATPPSASSAQGSTQNASTPGQQNTTSSPNSAAQAPEAASAQTPATNQPPAAAPATPSRERAIETQGSTSNAPNPATANGQLPQTSTILPLLGLIGLGSLVAGLFAR